MRLEEIWLCFANEAPLCTINHSRFKAGNELLFQDLFLLYQQAFRDQTRQYTRGRPLELCQQQGGRIGNGPLIFLISVVSSQRERLAATDSASPSEIQICLTPHNNRLAAGYITYFMLCLLSKINVTLFAIMVDINGTLYMTCHAAKCDIFNKQAQVLSHLRTSGILMTNHESDCEGRYRERCGSNFGVRDYWSDQILLPVHGWPYR